MNVFSDQKTASQWMENVIPRMGFMQERRITRGMIVLLPVGIAALWVVILFRFLSPVRASVQNQQVPNNITVNSLIDEQAINGNCSLREAITAANINFTVDKCSAGGIFTDTISFSVAGTITLTEQLPYISNAGPLVIDGGSLITLTSNYQARAFWVNPSAHLILQNLTIYRSGNTYEFEMVNGGGLYNNDGTVRIDQVIFTDNTGWYGPGGAIYNTGAITITKSNFDRNWSIGGGAIYNSGSGSLYIQESSFYENDASMFSSGGAIANEGVLEVIRSTFYKNSAESSGSGINNHGWMRITNSTFSDNWNWSSDGGTLENSGTSVVEHCTFFGGMKQAQGGTQWGINLVNCLDCLFTIQNSILTSEPPITNCIGTISDGGYNIDSQDTCGFNPINGSQVNTDPLLEPLQINGGATWTHALQAGSPAIDSANPLECPESDQRGVPRPFDGNDDGDTRCDIGAFEVAPPGTPRSTQTSISSISPIPALINTPIIINFQVSSAFGVPTGAVTVTVTDNGEHCIGSLTNGFGTCSLMVTEPGTYTLTAFYGGQGDYLPSEGTRVQNMQMYGAFLPQIARDYPASVEIVWSGIRINSQGNYEMIGQVMNVSDVPVFAVTLTALLYDQSGQLFATYNGTTALTVIFPDESMPFEFDIGQSSPNNYQLIPNWVYHSSLDYRPVSVISQNINDACPYLIIWGELRNDQAAEMKSIRVIVEPGGAGEFFGIATLGADSLLPGETTPYTHTQYHILPPCPSEFTVRGQGYLAP